MKRLSFIVMACLLALGLTQCKKNEPINNNNDDNRVSITLKLTNGGQKVHPEEDPETGWANVVYDNGDVVYVGSDGKYMGYLTYNGSVFVGNINAEATEGQPLQFVFMGGQTIEGLTENSSTECTFNIGDQSNGLAVISGAASNENFSLTNLSYTAYLRNKCALVKFDLGEVSTDAAITLTGMKTEATVGFDGTVTNGETTGDIVTYGTGTTRYAVVLSDQEAVTEGTVSAEGYEGTFSIPTAAYTNAFLTDATMTLTAAVLAPIGAINGLFTINTDGDQVYFSQGNLQYIGSAATPYWRFAENQWDYIGSTHNQGSSSQIAHRDLFGWGTSGYNHGATAYQPWATSSTTNDYYAYGNYTNNLYDQTGQADWGYNAISNGGNEENSGWRTLTTDEWYYVFDSRTSATEKWGHGNVNGVNGMILLPDDWTLPEGLNFTAEYSDWANVYTAEQWAQMETNGAVFLPAAGYRTGTSVYNVDSSGRYWSSSRFNSGSAYHMRFGSGSLDLQNNDFGINRYNGYSVRLVRNAE